MKEIVRHKQVFDMRKLMIALGALFLVAILSTSCKSHQTCPAYGSVESEQADKLPA